MMKGKVSSTYAYVSYLYIIEFTFGDYVHKDEPIDSESEQNFKYKKKISSFLYAWCV